MSSFDGCTTSVSVRGVSNKEIAQRLQISIQSLEVYVSNLLREAGVPNRGTLALHAVASEGGVVGPMQFGGSQSFPSVLDCHQQGKGRVILKKDLDDFLEGTHYSLFGRSPRGSENSRI